MEAPLLGNLKKFGSKKKTPVFEGGSCDVCERTVETSDSDSASPPNQLLIISPTSKGKYPVIVFLHGYALSIFFYRELLKHIASHGYITVSPQLSAGFPCKDYDEIKSSAEVTNWLSTGLQSVLPEKVQADLEKLALVGHSRGGKTAFTLALEPSKTSLKFCVLVAVDPVAGFAKGIEIKPTILTNVPASLATGFPVMVIGTGLGGICAPTGMNHQEFFYESQPPCYHYVAKDYGHLDILDDDLNIMGKIMTCFCTAGKGAKDPMRRCVGGLIVAFLEKYLHDEEDHLEDIVEDPSIAPVALSPSEYVKS
ncbi:chlorophyllase [Ranunculus cassubicifolius]